MVALARLASLLLASTPALVAAQGPAPTAEPAPPAAYAPPAPAYAGGPSRTYVAVKLGLVAPQHSDLDGMDSGFAIEGTLGYRLHPNIALELSLGRWSMSGSESITDPTVGTINGKLEFVGYPLLLTAKAVLPLDRIQLYALAGGGVHFVTATAKLDAPGLGLTASESDSSSPFAFHFGGGLSVDLAPRIAVGAEVRYVIGEMTAFDATGHFDHLFVAGTLTFSL